MVQNFREIAEDHMNVNFCDKNFVIATFFVISTMCGQCVKRNESKETRQDDPFLIPVLRQRLSRL